MIKSAEKKHKNAAVAGKTKKIPEDQTKAAKYLGCLQELHKLQGVLLARLQKEIKSLTG